MKYYLDTNNTVHAYELDGSQDHLIGDKTAVTRSQVTAMIAAKTPAPAPAPTKEELMAQLAALSAKISALS
jgi:hypothetical protein